MSLGAACPGALAVRAGTPPEPLSSGSWEALAAWRLPQAAGKRGPGSACRGLGLEGSGPAQKEQGLPV